MTRPDARFPEELLPGFEPLRRLGSGGMGAVFLARDRNLDRLVAVKVMRGAEDEEQRRRFRREAQVLSELEHPNIVRIHDSGVSASGPWILMEHLDGSSLDKLAGQVDPLDAMVQIASGLEELHRRGLVHRDVKPGNVVLDSSGRAVLVDFGLVLDPKRTGITRQRAVTGTLGFLAPEVLRGDEATAAADWYAWGVTLFQLSEGRLPFDADELLACVRGKPLPEPEFERLGPGDRRTQAIRAALAEEPGLRPTSRAEIEELLAGKRLATTRARTTLPEPGPTRPEGRHRVALAAGITALLGLALLGGFLQGTGEGREPRPGPGPRLPEPPTAPVRPPDPGPASPSPTASPGAPTSRPVDPRDIYSGLGMEGIADLVSFRDELLGLAWSPDGTRIAAGSSRGNARVFEVASGALAEELDTAGSTLVGVAWDATGGTRAVATWGGKVVVRRGRVDKVFGGERGAVLAMALSRDGRRVALGGMDRTLEILDTGSGARLAAFPRHPDEIGAVAFAPDGGTVLSGCDDGIVRLWSVEPPGLVYELGEPSGPVYDVAMSPDGRWIASGHLDGRLRLWDARGGERLRVLEGHTGQVTSVEFSPDGRTLASGSWDAAVRLWDPATGASIRVLEGHTKVVRKLRFAPDGARLASLGEDRKVRIWTLPAGRQEASLDLEREAETQAQRAFLEPAGTLLAAGTVEAVAWSEDGTRVAVGLPAGEVRVGEPRSAVLARPGEAGLDQVRTLVAGGGAPVVGLAFASGGKWLAVATRDGSIRLYDVGDGELAGGFTGHRGPVTALATRNDGSAVAAADGEGGIWLWSTRRGKAPARLEGPGAPIGALAFSPDGRMLAAGGADGRLQLRELGAGPPRTVTGSERPVTGLAFPGDGGRLLVLDAAGRAALVEIATGARLAVQELGPGARGGLAISSRLGAVAVGGEGGGRRFSLRDP